jgi:hypothetical protein
MNPAAAGAQEDASTLSSNDTNPVKLHWSKMKPDEKRPIQEVISQQIWPTWKLIGDSGEDEQLFTQKVFELMNPTLGAPADTAVEIAWKVKYKNACISCFNAIRSNIVSQMKDKTEVWWTQHKKTMPIMVKLQAIVMRDIDLVAPAADGVIDAALDKNMELFVWWWDELLPCATAPNTEFWTNEKRWYHHIHDGKVGDEPLLTPQDETFAFLCFKNYYRQWEKDFQIKAKHPKKSSLRPTQKTSFPPLIPDFLKGVMSKRRQRSSNLERVGRQNTQTPRPVQDCAVDGPVQARHSTRNC